VKFLQAGVILYTQRYQECVDFYEKVLELEILHEIDRVGEQLTTFSLGGTYLMVETGGVSHVDVKTIETSPVKFRFNVVDVESTCKELRSKGVELEVIRHSWGTTAEFADPDGNLCALRSDNGFGD